MARLFANREEIYDKLLKEVKTEAEDFCLYDFDQLVTYYNSGYIPYTKRKLRL